MKNENHTKDGGRIVREVSEMPHSVWGPFSVFHETNVYILRDRGNGTFLMTTGFMTGMGYSRDFVTGSNRIRVFCDGAEVANELMPDGEEAPHFVLDSRRRYQLRVGTNTLHMLLPGQEWTPEEKAEWKAIYARRLVEEKEFQKSSSHHDSPAPPKDLPGNRLFVRRDSLVCFNSSHISPMLSASFIS